MREEVLNIISYRLAPITQDYTLLSQAVDDAQQRIRAYCNRQREKHLPRRLKYVWADMASDIVVGLLALRVNAATSNGDSATGAVKKIVEGDTTIEYETSASITSGVVSSDGEDLITARYAARLNAHRRVYDYDDC
ncbi:MAG: hypothetical protein LBQ80_04215 [Clostridium sp.]|jgi:hypothetical protein|nr:hypothetical protein [Clostridium sp.]